ncbi:MAG: phosphatase PAP2 family protein [Thermoplasmata archaeon]|nr:phosphatase PAP2 family protein [Thermoplasmata archaeon]
MWTGIELLYPIQDLRMDISILEDAALLFSSRIFYLVLPMFIITVFYWTIDKKKGEFLSLGFISAMAFTAIAKYAIAQPRPWVSDPDIEHVDGTHASSYSCPSGHTANTVSSLIPASVVFGKRAISAALILLTMLVIMSRIILCVHTPIDIIAGIAVGLSAALMAWKAVEWSDDGRKQDIVTVSYTAVFTVLFILAFTVWDADAEEMLGHAGMFYGLMVSRFFERRYVGYAVPDMDLRGKAIVLILGLAVAGLLLLIPYLLIPGMGRMAGALPMSVWMFLIYPKLVADGKIPY